MKILLFHPLNSTNTGDKVILKGVETILRDAYGEVEFYKQELDDSTPIYKAEKIPGVNLLVVSGTPWFWEACHRSNKYRQLESMIEKYSEAKKVGLGLGSCFPLVTDFFTRFVYPDKRVGKDDWRAANIETIRESFGKFDLLFTRDRVAQEVLAVSGLQSIEAACPAVFACKKSEIRRQMGNPLLIFQNPEVGVSKESCDAYYKEQHLRFQNELIQKLGCDVITMGPLDADCLRDQLQFIPELENPMSTWVRSPDELIEKLKNHNPVFSSRIHAAIPSRVLGNLTFAFPMDSRYLAATKTGVIPVFTQGYPGIIYSFKAEMDMSLLDRLTNSVVEETHNLMITGLRNLL